MWRKLLVCLGIAVGVLMATASTARAENVLKFGTLAPQRSPWGQVLGVWQRAVKERTKGELEVRFYWNGTQGDELSMVDKIRSGQLHGAAIRSVHEHFEVTDAEILGPVPGRFSTEPIPGRPEVAVARARHHRHRHVEIAFGHRAPVQVLLLRWHGGVR